MSKRASAVAFGLTWIVLSPIALLMALISTVESLTVYYVQVALFGAWATCGMVSGIGQIASASWAPRIQTVLSWLAFAYFTVCAVLLVTYSILSLFKANTSALWFGFPVAMGVFLTGALFLFLARKQAPKPPQQEEKSPHEHV